MVRAKLRPTSIPLGVFENSKRLLCPLPIDGGPHLGVLVHLHLAVDLARHHVAELAPHVRVHLAHALPLQPVQDLPSDNKACKQTWSNQDSNRLTGSGTASASPDSWFSNSHCLHAPDSYSSGTVVMTMPHLERLLVVHHALHRPGQGLRSPRRPHARLTLVARRPHLRDHPITQESGSVELAVWCHVARPTHLAVVLEPHALQEVLPVRLVQRLQQQSTPRPRASQPLIR